MDPKQPKKSVAPKLTAVVDVQPLEKQFVTLDSNWSSQNPKYNETSYLISL